VKESGPWTHAFVDCRQVVVPALAGRGRPSAAWGDRDGRRASRETETEARVGTASLTWLRRTQTQEQSSRPGRRPVVGCRSRGRRRRRNKTARRRLPLLRPGSIGVRTACYVHASIPASSWTGGPLASGLILGRAIDRPSITRLATTSWRRRFQENSSLQCKSDRQTACVFTRNCQLVCNATSETECRRCYCLLTVPHNSFVALSCYVFPRNCRFHLTQKQSEL